MKRLTTLMVMALAFALVANVTLAAGDTFTKTLKKGSSGAEVSALQTILISQNLLGVSAPTGYFGSLTVAAVKAYQTKHNLAAVGQVGPATRAALNNEGTTASSGGTTVPPTGSTGGTSTGATGITTPGVEGILSVTAGPVTTSVVNAGQKMVPVLAVRAQAQNSDIAIQRITLNLGSDTKIYNKVYSSLYVMNGSAVVATIPLNSTTVVQNGTTYVVNATGFNIIVPKNTYKDITIAADLYSTIDSKYTSGNNITIGQNGVRGVDGAGIVQYGPAGSSDVISQNITINQSLVDNSQANISTDPLSPQTNLVPVTDTTNGQYLQLPVLTFAVNAQNDTLHIRNLKVTFATSGSATGTASVAYLYQGSTMVQSASIIAGVATFSNIVNGTAGASIPVNTTLPYTIKVDVSGISSGTLAITATVATATGAGTTILNSQDGTVLSVNGSASGFPQTVAVAGPAIALASAPTTPTISATNQTPGGATTTTMKYTVNYVLNIAAVGTDLTLNLAGTSSPAFSTTTLEVWTAGATTTPASLAVDYHQPTGTTAVNGGTGFVISRGQTVQVPVTYTFTTNGVGLYSARMAGVTISGIPQTFMKTLSSWLTNAL